MTIDVAAPALDLATRHSRTALWRRLARSRSGAVGLLLTGIVAVMGVAAMFGLTPDDPTAQVPVDRLQGPSPAHWFGTDQFGRDILSRSMAGIANSLTVAVVAVALSGVIGTLAGVSAGYFGGPVRASVLGATNVLFAFPPLLLALALASAFARTWLTIAVAIAIVYIPIFVRVTRGPVLSLREAEFVQAARVLGFSTSRILLRHVLPNILPIVIVQVTLSLSWAVLTEASLSFLGLGTPPPNPSWGGMLGGTARFRLQQAPWLVWAPAIAISLVVLSFNLLGDALRDVLDPRLRGGR